MPCASHYGVGVYQRVWLKDFDGILTWLGILDSNTESLVYATFALMPDDTDPSNLDGAGYVGASVGLKIKTMDLQYSYFRYSFRQQIDFCANEIWDGHCFDAGYHSGGYRMVSKDLLVHSCFNFFCKLRSHVLELEIHACCQRLHVASGDLRVIVPPNDTTEYVEGCVGAHELVASVPIQHPSDRVSHKWWTTLNLVDNHVIFLADLWYVELQSANTHDAHVIRLASPTGVKGRLVEHDPRVRDTGDGGLELIEITIFVIEEFGQLNTP